MKIDLGDKLKQIKYKAPADLSAHIFKSIDVRKKKINKLRIFFSVCLIFLFILVVLYLLFVR